jgi:hypothetical protein
VWQTTQRITANSKNKISHKQNTKQKELITKTALQRKTFHTIIITHFQNILLQMTVSTVTMIGDG